MNHDFARSVGYWVGLTAHTLEKAMNAEMAETGITLRQVQVLACLVLHGNLSQSEIANLLHIEASTIVRVLDRMQRDGWIVRQEDTKDRRRKIVSITEKVRPHWALIVERGQRIERQAVKGLSPQQLTNLQATLAVIRKNIEEEQ